MNPQKGFTLIEVLIAVVILASCLVFMAEGLARSQQALRAGETLVQSSIILQNRLVEFDLKQREFGQIAGAGTETGQVSLPPYRYSWVQSSTVYSDASLSDQSLIDQGTASVEWQEGRRGKSKLEAATLYMKREKEANSP